MAAGSVIEGETVEGDCPEPAEHDGDEHDGNVCRACRRRRHELCIDPFCECCGSI